MEPLRKIIHIDMDAFYASVEQRDHPEYAGKPVIVGGSPQSRGVVATASYEARRFGVKSAMSSHRAFQLCPEGIFVPPRFDVYKAVSQHIRAIFRRYTDIIEPLSLDEAFLDVTTDKQQIGSAIEIARRIKNAIREELQLTASAGVSSGKFVAKIASDMHKPDGLTFIHPDQITAFMEALPVDKFFGVGKVTAAKMRDRNLLTGADIKKLTEAELVKHFGKPGKFYYQIVRGIDNRPVRPDRIIKSLGAEDTFARDLDDPETLRAELARLAAKVAVRLAQKELRGRTLTLKVKFSDFRQITRNHSFPTPVATGEIISEAAVSLLAAIDLTGKKIRLLGITLSNFDEHSMEDSQQLSLF